MLLIIMANGIMASIAAAQPAPADLPPTQPRYGYGAGGYGEGGGYEVGEMQGYGYGAYGRRDGGDGRAAQRSEVDPRETRKLVERWKTSENRSERDNIEKSLREMLQAEFRTRLEAHEKEIKQLEEKVRQLRVRLDLRREKQNEIVDHRLQQILREAQGLGWGGEGIGGQALPMPWQLTEGMPENATSDLFGAASDNLFGPPSEGNSSSDLEPTVAAGIPDDAASSEPQTAPPRN
jgi:hypothetical protein